MFSLLGGLASLRLASVEALSNRGVAETQSRTLRIEGRTPRLSRKTSQARDAMLYCCFLFQTAETNQVCERHVISNDAGVRTARQTEE